jgi:mannose-6-phosphate isomerase-like protein (cupin superfamily)
LGSASSSIRRFENIGSSVLLATRRTYSSSRSGAGGEYGFSADAMPLKNRLIPAESELARSICEVPTNSVKSDGMPRLIEGPTIVQAAGNKPKQIQEFAGRVNSGHSGVSVARMVSPAGWREPGQRPEFEEITVVLRGMVRVEHDGGVIDVRAGQAVVASPGEWIRYSSPEADGAEYIAVCMPAFSPDTVHRDQG